MTQKRKFPEPSPSAQTTTALPSNSHPETATKNGDTNVLTDPTQDPNIYNVQKRLPMRKTAGKRDIYISRSTRFEALTRRAVSLLDDGDEPVMLHGMGAAILLCCSVALAVQRENGGNVALSVNTTTVQVYDDYEPIVEGYPEVTRSRSKSGIRIKISKTKGYV